MMCPERYLSWHSPGKYQVLFDQHPQILRCFLYGSSWRLAWTFKISPPPPRGLVPIAGQARPNKINLQDYLKSSPELNVGYQGKSASVFYLYTAYLGESALHCIEAYRNPNLPVIAPPNYTSFSWKLSYKTHLTRFG